MTFPTNDRLVAEKKCNRVTSVTFFLQRVSNWDSYSYGTYELFFYIFYGQHETETCNMDIVKT